MTPDARRMLRIALGQVQKNTGKSLLQLDEANQQPASTEVNTTSATFPSASVETLPVSEEPNPDGQWKKCVDGTPNCGLLHDLMSIEWGKFRDGFDELTAEMNQNKEEFDTTKRNINEELTVIN